MDNIAATQWKNQPTKLLATTMALVLSASSLLGDVTAKKETQKRMKDSAEAVLLVEAAEIAYKAKDYAKAVNNYKQALGLLPEAPATREYKQALRDNYATAAVSYAKQLNREGNYEKASLLLASLLDKKGFAKNKNLKTAENKLLDPIRNNPATTPEHAANVDKVRRHLYKAYGFYNTGQLDAAAEEFRKVIRIDPYNKAARRGMTQVNKQKSIYGRAAYDATRAELLTQVDKGYDIKSPIAKGIELVPDANDLTITPIQSSLLDTLSSITIPRFDLEEATLEVALSRFRQLCKQYDRNKKGVNVVLSLGNLALNPGNKAIAERTFTLSVREIPANELLNLICRSTETEWSANQHTVTVLPAGQSSDQFFTQSFRVPPSFMLDAGEVSTKDSSIWTDIGDGKTVVQARLTAKQYLEKLGVKFPEGTSALYAQSTGILTVTNNPENMRAISSLVERSKLAENVVVNVRFRVIDMLQNDLEELGYDWITGHHSFDSSSSGLFIGGGNAGNGTPIDPIQLTGPGGGNRIVSGSGVTSGLRSGSTAFEANSLDSRLGQLTSTSQASQSAVRAPGILQGTAFLDDSHLQVIMRGVNQKKGSSKIWSPSVTVRPGSTANIQQVRLFTYPTEYDPPELPDNLNTGGGDSQIQVVPITPATPTAFEEKPLGNSIQVSATVGENRRNITLEINPEFSEFRGFINYGSPILGLGTSVLGTPTQIEVTRNDILMPVFEKISAATSVTIADGHTIAVGGLNRVELEQVNDSVPVLSKLPFIGDYYKSNGTRTIRRAVIILVTAELQDTTGRKLR